MTMTRARNQAAFDRFSRLVDGPLMVLALLMIPLLVIPLVMQLSETQDAIVVALDYFIWAVFAIEYFTKLFLSPDRKRFVRSNIPDLVIVIVPFLRPLRVLRSARLFRLLRLTRLIAFAVESVGEVRQVMRRKGLNYALLIVVFVVLICALLVDEFEKGVPGANVHGFAEGLWWAMTTITTVGYGDRFPVSPAGRGVAVVLMLAGIALFGVLTASIAAYFVEQDQVDEPDDLNRKLDEILERLTTIERQRAQP